MNLHLFVYYCDIISNSFRYGQGQLHSPISLIHKRTPGGTARLKIIMTKFPMMVYGRYVNQISISQYPLHLLVTKIGIALLMLFGMANLHPETF